MHDESLKPPTTPQDWMNISDEFERLWNFPHCIGAIDGKHVAVKCPLNSGSLYFNYKSWFSIVLLAICDAHYIFTLVDIGNYGSSNDSSILSHSTMGQAFEAGEMFLPNAKALAGWGDYPLPYFLVGDEAFALKPWMQRPFSGKELPEDKIIFNYRPSRARKSK